MVVSDDELINYGRRNENDRIRKPGANGLQSLPSNRGVSGEVEEKVCVND